MTGSERSKSPEISIPASGNERHPANRNAKEGAEAYTEFILDNYSGAGACHLGKFLKAHTPAKSRLSIVSAFFSIAAYEHLQGVLDSIEGLRFLYGNPAEIPRLPSGERGPMIFGINPTSDGERLSMLSQLRQSAIARDCANWLAEKAAIRQIKIENFMHGKMFHIQPSSNATPEGSEAVVGSSNFTGRGLGFGQRRNIELNIRIDSPDARRALLQWFDKLWNDSDITEDIKDRVLADLRRLYERVSPEDIYYKTLSHIFEERLKSSAEDDALLENLNLYDTQIWQALYPFQKDGVRGAINRLMNHNGCILADSVGLGKTYEALAVIKFFEMKNARVLVLCPKRLKDNWTLYPSRAAREGNPFEKDRFGYTVLAHTDLTRDSGKIGEIDLANFKWENHDLIVIDESHNFRNASKDRIDESGRIIGRSRYQRLMDAIGQGGRTKVLMLSATPVNTSLEDLRNQIYLITEGKDEAFNSSLHIDSIKKLIRDAQSRFKGWENSPGVKNKNALLEKLGGGFITLLDAISIARSRRHITEFYKEFIERGGGFTNREEPRNLHPPTDSKGELSYEDLHSRISDFTLSIYAPSHYLISEEALMKLDDEKKTSNFNQKDRERFLIGMMRVNFLKRLESSAYAFRLTLTRTVTKIDDLIDRIEKFRKLKVAASDPSVDTTPEEDEEDEDFNVGKGRVYNMSELNLPKWLGYLRKDRKVLGDILDIAEKVTVERDAKLERLKAVIWDKIKNPAEDKDGRKVRKVIVFTAFADTAEYLFDNLKDEVVNGMKTHIAQIAGGDRVKTTHGERGQGKFADILTSFSPRSRSGREGTEEIDILIATDCISEGQNLQDCNMVVNYDIHWNPVRLIQRFGRIDRIGSRHKSLRMVNFWPTKELNKYLDLKNRVEARMALADLTATGSEDLLTEDKLIEDAQGAMLYRNEQLKRLQNEVIDLEDMDDSPALSDFTLDDFIAELRNYLQRNKEKLDRMPFGLYAVAECPEPHGSQSADVVKPGVIFCLRYKGSNVERQAHNPNPVHPYYLAYVRNTGEVRYRFVHAKQILAVFGDLCRGVSTPIRNLCDDFERETENGRDVSQYNTLLENAVRENAALFQKREAGQLSTSRGAVLTRSTERPNTMGDFELVTWLVIRNNEPSL